MRKAVENTKTKIDRADQNLLAALHSDALATNAELAGAVHLSPTAVARRQKALEDSGVIRGYHADIDLAKFGLCTTVVVHITLKTQTETSLVEFEERVELCDSVVRCLLMSGADDYLLILRVKDLPDFERVHKTQLSRLPHVARIQSSFALREIVSRSIPRGVLEPR
jgi:Lrp/AsnC family transcriptional regulator, leucine-responsive regulatory protein